MSNDPKTTIRALLRVWVAPINVVDSPIYRTEHMTGSRTHQCNDDNDHVPYPSTPFLTEQRDYMSDRTQMTHTHTHTHTYMHTFVYLPQEDTLSWVPRWCKSTQWDLLSIPQSATHCWHLESCLRHQPGRTVSATHSARAWTRMNKQCIHAHAHVLTYA